MVDRVTVDKPIAWVVGVGASRGLGAAAARRFAPEGFAVAVTGRSPEALAIIADEISTAGGHAIAAVGDVQDETGIIAILDRLGADLSRSEWRRLPAGFQPLRRRRA